MRRPATRPPPRHSIRTSFTPSSSWCGGAGLRRAVAAAATRSSTWSLLQRPRGEIGVQLPMQVLLKSCELLCTFVTEAIQRSAFIAEAEDGTVIEPTHLERVAATALGFLSTP